MSKKTLQHIRSLQNSPSMFDSTAVDGWNQSWAVWKEHTILCVEKKQAQHTNTKSLIQTQMYGEEGIMLWGCLATSGPGYTAVIDRKINSQIFQDILQKNLWPSFHQLQLNRWWVMQQDSNPKQRSKSTTQWHKT